ncbi:MAG: phosphatase PAP2 family protein [Prevotellaceae bacterium]|nr:phosphatase PAP2 family protein [Prevotellaceae bacterium]
MRKFTHFILLFGVCAVLSIPVKAQNADIDLLRRLNHSPSGLRNYSSFVSQTTYFAVVSVPLVVGATALIRQDDDLLKDALYITASMAATTVLTTGLKYGVNRERPYNTYPGQLDVAYLESSPSFPSAHTSIAFTTATSLSLKYPKWYVIVPSYAWAVSVGYSRMNLGVHYPSDVLAGALLGAGSSYLTYKINNWFWKKNGNKKLIGLQAYL